MPKMQASIIELSERQQSILESMSKGTHTPLHLKQRATIILEAGAGRGNSEMARTLQLNRNTVKKWRIRWSAAGVEIARREAEHPRELRSTIESVLQDDYRPGAPATFTNEEVAQIIALSLQPLPENKVEGSHWTPSELARKAVSNHIVDHISPRSVARFLKREPL